jgi:hypothetical protein
MRKLVLILLIVTIAFFTFAQNAKEPDKNATHEITRSGNNRQRIDQMLRTYEFFERWLKK